ncbi:hypothetical protein WDU99_01735 [Microbacterium sp. Mu-80]|uniref:Uncharacterized protein n=1 Tax=Microbacterium bandirmense TaxID=3122050 RepID=A0ABU8L8I3_9MICO
MNTPMRIAGKDRVCAPNMGAGRAVCGRRLTAQAKTGPWDKVTCPDCHAAARAGG